MPFNDERDLCFTCQRSPEVCDDNNQICRYKEATANKHHTRNKIDLGQRQESVGFKEVPLWSQNDGMTKFSEAVAKYSEPWMDVENRLLSGR